MKRLLLLLIHFYRSGISPLMPPHCRYYPTCSAYAAEAIERAAGGWRSGAFCAVIRFIGAATIPYRNVIFRSCTNT